MKNIGDGLAETLLRSFHSYVTHYMITLTGYLNYLLFAQETALQLFYRVVATKVLENFYYHVHGGVDHSNLRLSTTVIISNFINRSF